MFIAMTPLTTAAQGLSIIRDTEIEGMLHRWSEPIFEQAGLTPAQVNLILVESAEVNAFVAGGANIFIYTGLIQKADYPEEVIGVIAHEVGHIVGGHLIEKRRASERASFQSILATVLGVGAAVLSGDGAAAGAISSGGSNIALRGYLTHSRIHESAADQAALRYLDAAEINPAGLTSFLEKLQGEELLPASQQSEYMRTHPLTRDRVESMRIGAEKSNHYGALGTTSKQNDFNLMKAKLDGFITPQSVVRRYDINSGATQDLYAHAIMHYRQWRFDKALPLFNQLIQSNPDYPYFLEMKGQALRDQGRLAEAERYYRRALSKIDTPAPLINMVLAHVMIEQLIESALANVKIEKQGYTNEIETLLLSAIQHDDRSTHPYRLMAKIKGWQGYAADAQYFLAEEAIRRGQTREARRLITLATLDKGVSAPYQVKANDLKIFLDGLPDDG